MILRNIGKYSHNDTLSHPRISESSATLPLEPPIPKFWRPQT